MGSRHDVYSARGAGILTSRLRTFLNPPDRVLDGYIHTGDTVLDFGCGPGYFTLPMARMVRESGRVVAVDVQEEMLSILHRRAEEAGLARRIRIHRSLPDSLAINGSLEVAFALAYHVLHETGNQGQILGELAGILRRNGLLLIAEPRYVVNRAEFRATIEKAVGAGLSVTGSPGIFLSRTALLRRS